MRAEVKVSYYLVESTTSTTVYPIGALQFHTSSTIHLAVSTTPMFHSHMCRPEKHRGRGQNARISGGGRAPSHALCAARTPQFSRISLWCWDLHWHLHLALATIPCSIPIFRPERNRHKGQNARVSGGRAPSFARALRGGAHSPQFSRISLWCRDLHLGTCIGKRNGEERARPACKGRLVGGAYSGSRKIRR